MIHRPAALSQIEPGGQSSCDIRLSALNGVLHGKAFREIRCNSAGKGASRAVGIGIVDPLAPKPDALRICAQQIAGIAHLVSALAENGAAVFPADDPCRRLRRHLCFA